ncbi:MAG: quinohemoprotein amine dehydrogenase subunit alpha [Vicinamibacterales bacterium]|nr:quinohemoprotein amine dehydrogenase subunit alpha [Vicinamibacterales bacterium]
MSRLFAVAALLWLTASAPAILAQTQRPGSGGPAPATPAATPEEGIPVPSFVVQKSCATCHRRDEQNQLTRISYRRTTPEGWQQTVRRMVALNGVQLDPAEAREIVKYLSNHLGLAPEEARPAAFEVQRRLEDYTYEASSDVQATCSACHSMGRVISQRRTRSEWDLLIAMHRGWYPLIDSQGFRRMGPAPTGRGADGRPPDTRHPVEKAVDHLAQAFPLKTPEWSAWSATMRPPRLEGTWALSGWEPGKGAVFGRMVIAPVANMPDEFTTTITYQYARGGETVARAGRVVVYTGFQWRGRSTVGGDDDTSLREVMFVDRDWRAIDGRWYTGGYDEEGLDVRLERIGAEPRVLGTDITALRVGQAGQALTIHGAALPAGLTAAQIDLGPGVTIASVESASADAVRVTVDVAADAAVGMRDLFVGGASKAQALAVYDRVDAITVTPAWNMARVGGVQFPKMLAQFEAWGRHNGPDGRPGTPDDLNLGVVPATWTVEEFTAIYGDDDVKFVGEIDPRTGRFTPNIDGPNPGRAGERNNIGDVWVVASYQPEGAPAPLRARAHLLVTVPLYMRWDPSVTQ